MSEAATRSALAEKSYLALVHHPVYDRHGQVVATSITNLDIHDIARSSRTYGLGGYYLVHPVSAQRELARRIVTDWGHWREKHEDEQADYRREALALVRLCASLEEATMQVQAAHGQRPLVISTSAKAQTDTEAEEPARLSPAQLRARMAESGRPLLLVLGTGWGLTRELLRAADGCLMAISGPQAGAKRYNHLSVRSAAAIMLDRLFAEPPNMTYPV